jgi:hypothetical protein
VKDGCLGFLSTDVTMAKNEKPTTFRSPGFVDLFYAVVVGGSFNLIANVDDWVTVALKIFLIIVVLEDWFAYYSFVLPNIVQKQRYTLYSLSMEFLILMSWYLAVASLNSDQDAQKKWVFACLAAFFLVRFWTGLRAHWRRSTLKTREFFSECLYFLQACITSSLYFLNIKGCVTIVEGLLLFGTSYVILTAVWWSIRYQEFMKRDRV